MCSRFFLVTLMFCGQVAASARIVSTVQQVVGSHGQNRPLFGIAGEF
jgi:hypothetical protein